MRLITLVKHELCFRFSPIISDFAYKDAHHTRIVLYSILYFYSYCCTNDDVNCSNSPSLPTNKLASILHSIYIYVKWQIKKSKRHHLYEFLTYYVHRYIFQICGCVWLKILSKQKWDKPIGIDTEIFDWVLLTQSLNASPFHHWYFNILAMERNSNIVWNQFNRMQHWRELLLCVANMRCICKTMFYLSLNTINILYAMYIWIYRYQRLFKLLSATEANICRV